MVCEPDHSAAPLVITLDAACVNRIYQADGHMAATLSAPEAGWHTGARGRLRADKAFTGLNVDAHNIRRVRLRFVQRTSCSSEPDSAPCHFAVGREALTCR